MSRLTINSSLSIDADLIDEQFTTSSGPGGQNVNKVATAVILHYRLAYDPSLPSAIRQRLIKLAGSRLTLDGAIVLRAERYRTRERNREDAFSRLKELIAKAAIAPKPRRATKPSKASQTRRMDSKTKRGRTKALRKRQFDD